MSLAVFFGGHVFFAGGQVQPAALVIGIAAAVALLRYRVGTIKLILACAVAGLVLSL
jgi:chromate transporter